MGRFEPHPSRHLEYPRRRLEHLTAGNSNLESPPSWRSLNLSLSLSLSLNRTRSSPLVRPPGRFRSTNPNCQTLLCFLLARFPFLSLFLGRIHLRMRHLLHRSAPSLLARPTNPDYPMNRSCCSFLVGCSASTRPLDHFLSGFAAWSDQETSSALCLRFLDPLHRCALLPRRLSLPRGLIHVRWVPGYPYRVCDGYPLRWRRLQRDRHFSVPVHVGRIGRT